MQGDRIHLMAEETPKQWSSEDEAELDRQIREADEVLRSAPSISSEIMRGPQEGASSGGYDTGIEVAVGEGDESGRTKRTSAAREVRIMDDGSAQMDVYEKGRDDALIRRVRKLKQGDAIFNDAGRKFYSDKPHLQGRWTWDESRQDFVKDGTPSPQSPSQRNDVQTPVLKGQQPGESDEVYEARLLREQDELLKRRGATQADVDRSAKASIKKRARKRVVLGRKGDDSQDDGGDDTSTGIRPGTQERLKSVLALRKGKYNIPDDVIKGLSDQIDAASTTADLQSIEDQINKDFGTEYGKKKTGKRKSARTGSGDIDVGEKKGRKVSMERMPDGRMKFITIEPDGTTTERIEGDEMKFGEGLEETPPEAWEEYGRRYAKDAEGEEDAADPLSVHYDELARWNNRSWSEKFWDWLNRKEPPRPRYAPEVLAMLSDKNRTAEERKLIHMVAQATEKHNGIRVQDAAERGEKGRFARIRESLKGGGKAVAIATAITVAVAMSGGSLAAMPLLAKVIGAGTGALASTWAKNRVEKIGRTDKISRYVVPWMIGTIAGVATGAAAGHAIEAIGSYFSSAVPEAPVPLQGGGQAGANAIAPSGRGGVLTSSLIPAAPPGFDLGDYGYLGNKVILEPGSNIWSQITSGLCDQGLLDGKGRAAFADAFYRTVEDGGFKDLFLSYNNRPLGSGVFWNNLPVGTVGHYDRLLSDPKFVDMLVDRIGDNYPSLLKKINSGGFSAFDFIRGVAYSHGAKI